MARETTSWRNRWIVAKLLATNMYTYHEIMELTGFSKYIVEHVRKDNLVELRSQISDSVQAAFAAGMSLSEYCRTNHLDFEMVYSLCCAEGIPIPAKCTDTDDAMSIAISLGIPYPEAVGMLRHRDKS